MRAFLTGSYAYGKPRPDSDIDLVVLCEDDVLESIIDLADPVRDGDYAIRFGKLNLILCDNVEEFEQWKLGTEILIARRPVSREEACECFQQIRNNDGKGDSLCG